MPDYDDIIAVKQLLSDAQEAETDNREKVREVTHFLQKDDGQWEPSIVQNMSGRPRYTFDKCNPIVDSIAGEMEQAEFSIKVRPAGGDATKDLANLYDGIIRNIQSISNAEHVFDASGRKMVATGFDAWRVTQEWADADSFEQDLFIRKIANAVDRVWFDTGAEMQDMSDANWCFVLQALTKQKYEKRWPEGSGQSVSDARTSEVYTYKPDFITVGEFIYKKPVTKELVLMSNSAVYEVDEDFERVANELAAQGIAEVRRRKRKGHVVMSRFFDGKEWLDSAKETVFAFIPIIPTYANFDISEDKVIYRGAVDKLMDAQRVYNYTQSRAVEEGALAPRGKYWMTRKQAQSDLKTLQTMNTNADPVQFYTHIDGENPPFWQGGAQINQGLQQTSADMANNIIQSSGIFSANQGDAPNQSGFAIELQQQKGDNSTIKYFKSQEIAICHTARVLITAIPKVYDTKRQIRLLGEDGESRMETINDQVFDNETGEIVELNDLRKGKYDVTCDVGPAFKNRQQETARAFLDMAQVDPGIIQTGKDIWLKNLSVPGMGALAERVRKQMFEAGIIPDAQMTEDEQQIAQQRIAQAQAEAEAAAMQGPSIMEQAVIEQTQANTADIASRAQERTAKIEQAGRKQDLEEAKFIEQTNQNQLQAILDAQNQQNETNKLIVESLNTQAETLKTLREAVGVDTIVGPSNTKAYINQAEIVTEEQGDLAQTRTQEPI